MAELKRDLVKYVRDKAKSNYDKRLNCFICETTEELDFHHFHSLTVLLDNWLKKEGIEITTADEIKVIRNGFIENHLKELYEDCVTLCHTHHLKLHSIYGKKPASSTAGKQSRWVEKQRVKNKDRINGLV
jgi:hypothetical protein